MIVRGKIENKISRDGFKDIKGYEGLYMIDKKGRVLSCSKSCGTVFLKDRIMKPYLKSNGYYQVDLVKNGIRRKHYVHRLVAETFIPNPSCLPQINHKDFNRANNNVLNLEWCNNSYNGRYSNLYQRLRFKRGTKVKVTNVKNGKVIIALSLREASEILKDASDPTLGTALKTGRICKNKYKVELQ